MLVVCRRVALGAPGSAPDDALDLTVAPGEVCTVVGPSGCGKTRLCQLVSGAERPVRGLITVDGHDAADKTTEIRRHVTCVVPEAPLWPNRSTLANVEFVVRLSGLTGPDDRDVVEALRLSEVPDQLFRAPARTLSHFHRLGVWLAIHRLRQVRVLVLDDPFRSLTGPETQSLSRLIREAVEQGGCALITSRSADVPAIVASSRYRIARGRLVPIETPTSWIDPTC